MKKSVDFSLIDDKPRYEKFSAKKKELTAIQNRLEEALVKSRHPERIVKLDEIGPFINKLFNDRDKVQDEFKAIKNEKRVGVTGNIRDLRQLENGRYIEDADYLHRRAYPSHIDDISPKIPKSVSQNRIKLLGKMLPILGAGMALTSPDASSAVMDSIIPGGVETSGQDDREVIQHRDQMQRNSAISPRHLPKDNKGMELYKKHILD